MGDNPIVVYYYYYYYYYLLLLRKITVASILQASIVQNTGHIPPTLMNLFPPSSSLSLSLFFLFFYLISWNVCHI